MALYYTYILFSPACKRYYIGQTQNVEERLARHNKGREKSTKHCRPWELVHLESFQTRSEAYALEQKLKSFKNQAVLKQWIQRQKDK